MGFVPLDLFSKSLDSSVTILGPPHREIKIGNALGLKPRLPIQYSDNDERNRFRM